MRSRLLIAILGLVIAMPMWLGLPVAHSKLVCETKIDNATGTATRKCHEVPDSPDPKGNSKDVKAPPPVCRAPSGDEIDCKTTDGYWHAILRCYLKPDKSGEGSICTDLKGTQSYLGDIDVSAPPPDPRRVAWQLVAQAQLRAGQIGLVPDSEHALVGMPTWMWVDDPGPHTTGPLSKSATTNGYTVTIEARLAKVVYDMGDGNAVTCAGSSATGTRYQDRFGLKPSPTCGYKYQEPGEYTVTARSSWTISWYGVGQAGSLTFTMQRSLDTTVKEGHVVIR